MFCLDLLKLISRKAWLMMLAVKINKYTKQRLPAFSVPSLEVFTLCFMLLNFYYFLNRIKELKTFFSPLIFVFLTWLIIISLSVEKNIFRFEFP